METGILLESGTNELQVLEFHVGANYYGINVEKVKEIMPYEPPTPIPNSHPSIEGVYMPRDTIISIVDMAGTLGLPPSPEQNRDMFIITNFNKLNIGFHVHGVEGMHRLSWSDISKPDDTISSAHQGVATGIVKIEGKLIVILDFEKIVTDISPETGLKMADIEKLGNRARNEEPILIAEDSPLLSKMIVDCLHKAGYTNVTATNNGQEAWDVLQTYIEKGNIEEHVRCVITDIEMPQMDGHRLTKLIKDDPVLHGVPVVLFSSLINEEMRRKGESLGADAQLTKPEIGALVETIDRLLL